MTSQALHNRLGELKRRLIAIAAACGAGWGIVAGIGLLIACMWLDLMIELPPMLRLLSVVAGAAVVVIVLGRSFRDAAASSGTLQLANRLDRAADARGQVVSAVDLSTQPRVVSAGNELISQGLAEIAIRRAESIVARISPQNVLPNQLLNRPAYAVAIVGTLILAALLLAPRLVSTQWLRFAQPFADHPPYSRITFDVDPGNARVVYGSNLDLRVTPRGGEVEQLEIVLKLDGAADEEILPMFPGTGGQWQATIASVTTPGKYFVRTRGSSIGSGARTTKFNIDVITVPKITAARFRVTPPAYTHRPPYEGPLPQGGLAGLPGTTVEMWLTSNRPLSGGAVKIVTTAAPFEGTLAPTSAGADEAVASFTITAAGSLSATVVDSTGQRSTDVFTSPITLLADERPFVRMLDPKPTSFATPDVTIGVTLAAEDDYGVSRLQLYRGLNELRAMPEDVTVPKPEPVRLRSDSELALKDYGLKPGDIVKLYARVEDNDPAGAKGSESPIATIRIISNEQMERMLLARQGMEVLQSKYEAAMRRLEAIDNEFEKVLKGLEKLEPNSELAKAEREKIENLADQLQREAEALQKSANQDLPFDVDRAFRKHLQSLTDSVREAATETRATARQKGISAGQAGDKLKQMRKKLGGDREEFEKDATQPLEHLAKIYPVKEAEARFIELYQHQRELSERMRSLRGQEGKDDPSMKARMRDLEEEQASLQQDLRDLLADIDNRVAELPEDPKLDDLRKTATEFVKAVRASTADEQMAKSQESLADFKGTPAHDAAKEAADILEKFIGKCNGMGEQAGMCLKFNPSLSEGLGDTVEQLLESASLGGKPGTGMGNGGGYSARRSTLNNVGLYGHLPTRSSAAAASGGGNRPGVSTDGTGDADDPNNLGTGPGARTGAAGDAATTVPPQYRRRIGDYFRRVADELGEQQKR